MNVPTCISALPTPYNSCLAQAGSRPDSRLGELLAAIAHLNAINRAIAEVRAELATLRRQAAAVVTPNCKHGLREDWCAYCKERGQLSAESSEKVVSYVRKPDFIIDQRGENVTDEQLETWYPKGLGKSLRELPMCLASREWTVPQ